MPPSRPPGPAIPLDAPPPLSSMHFALRTARPGDRACLTALADLQHQLARLTHASDPAIAQAKLAWWRDELRRAAAGQAQHPVTRTLAPVLSGGGEIVASLHEAIAAWEGALQVGRLLDEAALLRHAADTASPLWRAAALSIGADAAQGPAGTLGAALRLAEIVALLGLDIRSGRLFIPIDDLQACDIKAHELLAGASAPAAARLEADQRYRAVMARQVRRARQRLQGASGELHAVAAAHAPLRRALRPAFVLAGLGEALLDEIEASDFAVLHQRFALAPLRKWWIALRAR